MEMKNISFTACSSASCTCNLIKGPLKRKLILLGFMMHSNLFILFWRRKLAVLFIAFSIILLAFWTWAFFDNDKSLQNNGHVLDNLHNFNENGNKHADLLQKLISQANRVLQYQRQQEQEKSQQQQLVVPAAAHVNGRTSSLLRVARPTNKVNSLLQGNRLSFEEASAQGSALEARRKKKAGSNIGETYLFEEERLKILENQQRVRNSMLEDINSNKNMDYERQTLLSPADRQMQYERDLQRMGVPVIAGIGPETPYVPQERLVHLDLKGAPPKLVFLKKMLPMLKKLGATGLLIEYEDMFPYTGVLAPLAAKNAYNRDELKDFLETATMHGLSIMPLIQTFGHMEFVLKLEEFKQLREMPDNPQSLCPSQQNSLVLIEEMLQQVIKFHSTTPMINATNQQIELPLKFTHIHIGCDEVYRMAECDKCHQHSRNEIFLNHVMTVANFIRSHSSLQVVIWDDMLRGMTLSEMQHSQIGSYVEIMIWVYANDIYHFIPPQLWDMYAQIFPTAWTASAFKGAFGESLIIPPLQRHLDNNLRWLAVMAKEGGRFAKGFKGVALTGWQRYDHFAVLCELLPTGMPSLITALSTVSKGYFATNPKDNDILKVLECAFHPDARRSGHAWIELQPNSHHSQLYSACNYIGSLAYKFTLRLYDKLLETHNYLQHVQEHSAWMSDYNARHNFSSPLRVHDLARNTPNYINELSTMAREAQQVLYDIYDTHTIAEFIEQHIYGIIAVLRNQLERADSLLQRNVWPRRPLPYARELLELNLITATADDRDAAADDKNAIPRNQEQRL